jgi:Family of unknown function (DUF6510)
MDDADLRLDGNAAAGLLAEIFTVDITSAQAVCSGCGSVFQVGTLPAYGLTMGTILRCPGCDTALVRVSRLASGYWLDLRGTSVLRVQATA